jgi:hypothetical protein
MAKQRQVKMQYRQGTLAAMQQLEDRTDEQLKSESKHRAAARAILGARAAEQYDAATARKYFNEALAGAHPQERPYLRQVMKAALAQAERRPDDLKEAMEKLGQEAPSNRQLLALRFMGLVAPGGNAPVWRRAAGVLLLIAIVIALLALGWGIVKLVALPFGGVDSGIAIFYGFVLVCIVLGAMAFRGRRKQREAREKAAAQRSG